jgi:hypothetical protein
MFFANAIKKSKSFQQNQQKILFAAFAILRENGRFREKNGDVDALN